MGTAAHMPSHVRVYPFPTVTPNFVLLVIGNCSEDTILDWMKLWVLPPSTKIETSIDPITSKFQGLGKEDT